MTSTHPLSLSKPWVKAVLFAATQALVLILLYNSSRNSTYGDIASFLESFITIFAFLIFFIPAMLLWWKHARNVKNGITDKPDMMTIGTVLIWVWFAVNFCLVLLMFWESNQADGYFHLLD
jgi:predicted permease